ncbi:hypothetical protein NFI96_020520 [Prochilodus magdalenae]|nr:hypothetical protein NFI96_020520 [Prochilodus magdalenae]
MDIVFGQARYSIPEEMPEGSFVGNIAKDLGIEISRLVSGKARVVTKGGRQYVELSRDKGALVVKERIDREEICKQTTPCSFSFDLIIENPIQLHRITVEVQDINDNAPKFPKSTVSMKISENTASGTRFPLDSAVDLDVGINGIQTYALNPTDNFKLEINNQLDGETNVEMVLQHELDREDRDELTLVLTAYDGGSPKKSSTVQIHITVLDINDNTPVCKQSVYKAEVRENSPVGTVLTTVSAADADEGINREVSYSFAQASEKARNLFGINSETGAITTLDRLDYETAKSYNLNIKAMDNGGLADTCKVIIDVMDENDNPPTIQLMSFSNTIAESSPVGTTVAVINVEDADSGQNGVVQCKINTDIPFKIESSISDYYALITDEILDRENTAEYNITILVSDQGSPALHSNKTLTVKISDVNDNAPVFDSDQYRTFITENNSPGVAVLTVKARDADWGPNARLSYFMEDSDVMGNPVSSLMSINSDSGVIHAVRSFDYEQMRSFSFNVTARDGGSPPLSSEVMVTVTVQDQNDNAPQVLYPVQTGGSLVAEIVPRSADVGYLVTKVVAVDVDSGQNAWLSYKLQRATDRALFEVGPQNGEIRTVRQVTDKDAVKQKLTVVVEDNGQPSRSAVVNINVAVADSFPEVVSEFSDFTQSREYNDNLTFYLVLALAAVSFLFITTVVVIISVKIYRWRQSRIFYQSNLPVIPYHPPGYADTGVTGTLPHMYNYDVCMTTNSRKSDCKYSTLGGQSVLVVDQSFSETLQRAMKEKEFLENAESPEEHRQKSTMQRKWQTVYFFLCVYGMDVVFGQARYSIPEEMPEGSFVGNIAKDLGIEISRLVSGKARVVTKGGRQYVELSRDKGALVVKERIDREELCKQTTPCSFSFDLIIENPIQLHRITVEVQDINDNAPVFPKGDVSLEISENTVSGARFPLDSAVDLDVEINGIQSYALSPNDFLKLEMNSQPDGSKHVEMVLQRELDREERDELKLVLIASDGGSPRKSGTVRIHVTVLDVNDNAPVCNQAVYKIDVKENSPVGTVLATVSAADADEGIYGQISYSIAQASKEARALFDINSETGDIKNLGGLDYENERSYMINIKAKDKDGLANTCKVIIDVIDENDNSPTIQLMSLSNTIAESSPVGTTVAVINVEDADSGQNGVVQCKINTDIPFKIESSISDYYALITDEILDRENTAEYNITILVSDQGSPALHSNKTLTVKISDVNDNAPVFDSDQYRAFITENNSPGVAVLTVKARDDDWGPNARLSYFLEDSDVMGSPVSSLMSINSDSGVIHAVRSFDYEQMKSFLFNVTARDGGSPPLSSEVMVTVTVQDQNDNAPQVLYPVQTGGSLVAEIVPRSADVGYLVTKVVAVDVDSGQNAWLSYKLQRATDRALFEVGPQNGEIRTVRQVTDKDAVKQKLTVVVEDNGQPSRSAVVNINVAVADSFPEVVSEFSDFTHSREYNDNLTFYLVLALAAVSFLFITTVVVIISVKIYRWRQSRIFYQSNLPVIPYYPPGYTDTGVTGTLPHMYNYDVCMTTNSRRSDCKYSTLGGQSVLVVDQSLSETLQRAMKEKEFLENAESPEEEACVKQLLADLFLYTSHRHRSRMQLKWQTVFFFLCVYGMDVVFGQARYSIPEEMPEGSFVGNIAKDLGIEISRLVSGKARVVTKGGRQYVELSRDKGALVVKERIDREELCKQTTPCSFSFDLIIENPIELHRITVEVQDINDNAPIFPKSTVNMKISENTASGTRFPVNSAVDTDVGVNGIQSYTLSPTDNFKLEINNQPDGKKYVEMVLQHELDREKHEQLKLVLTAYDGGSPKKSSTVQIHITVLDINDNTPVCKQSVYKAEVRENSPVGTVLTTVSAADADEGINGVVSYSFAQASVEATHVFEINSETGAITLLNRLDYETEKSYQLHIKAMDNGGLADTCKVIIDVIDENDNPPTIQLMSFSNTIAENSPVGTTVAVINVEDADSGQNGVVQCKINTDIPFKIESSISDYYALITDEILDRENTAEYNITILVSDQGSPALHSNKTLTVKISDVNDNAPVFDSDQYRAFITENNSPGVAVLTVKARDADFGPNARLSYFLEDSDVMGNPVSSLMSINSDSGVIHAVRSFDYEQMKSFSFNVTARDGGSPPLSSEVMVTVTVQDQNDNAPQVLYPVQTGGSLVAEIVPRSADVGYLVTKVVAVDVDSGQNAWLSYKLQRATDRALFEVGPQNGEIRTVRQVTDKDAVKQKLTVVVEDNGQPSRSAVVNINVAVADSFPEVVSEFSDFTHSREYNDNLTFYLVLALAAVSFLFITTVVVIISVKIYRWRQSRIFYQSNLPVIPYYPPGYADTGVTGTLPHMYNYDLEYFMTICMDFVGFCIFSRDRRSSTMQLKWQTVFFFLCVYGMDVVFGQARYSIPEEMPEGSFVGNIAKDLGIEISRLVSGKARVVTKGGRQYVELSRDKGALVVKERIDREELCKQTTPCSFSFDLIIENPIQLHRITVEVQDINDNAPKFPKSTVNMKISENTASGTRFPLNRAVDTDVGVNGIQSYTLSPTDNFKLEINNRADGQKYVEMVLHHELDREKHEQLTLVLTAYDGGSPKKSSTVQIHITVLDANDNTPVCKQSVYKAEVRENSPVGTVLTTVSAADADEGINGMVSYSFAQASEEATYVFEINSETGDITLLNRLDYETEKSYQVDIKAMDNWGLADTCKVIIDVMDENDNPPTIQLMSFSNTIAESSPVGTTVAVINVEDADSGQNGVVQCKINSDIPFKIESSISDYYALITDEILDRENTAEYNITILVSDQGSPALHSNKTLTVKISDVNDNAPVFDSDQYRTFITENNSPGVAVLTVKARDADWGPNARLSYFLEDSDVMGNPVSSLMSINSDSGVIHAVRSFDYEQMKSFSFNVTARDGGSPPLSSEVMVTVTVQDQNDNAPQVLYPVQTGGSLVAEIVPRSADVGYLVTKVVAVDVDSGQNAWLSYKLQRATDRALFEVGPQNGEIRTVRQVTDKDAVKQKLTVVVEDNGQPSRSAVVNINVAVADSFPEVVSEFSDFTHSREYNDNLTFYLVLALAAVSFLFITTVVVIISVKIYRWRQSRIFYQSNLPVIPYYPPGYTDTGVTGTLPHMYNYDHHRSSTMQLKWQTVFFFLCVYGMDVVFGQARYSIPEEMPEGSFVGNIAKDLGIEISRLVSGKARVVTKGGRQYVELSRDKGALEVKSRIDREELCKQTTPCSFSFDLIIENPIQLHRITVEVQDINDNAPKFQKSIVNMDISESTASGTRFPLDSAVDLDVGINGVQAYSLNPTDNFKLEISNQPDGETNVEMVLEHELDREDRDELKLVLTAYDGGSPKKSSTVQIHITVLDANDNTPVCKQSVYKAEVRENSPVGTVLTTVSAADADEGINGEVSYSFAQASEKARNSFGINSETGAITTLDRLDYETAKGYNLNIKAKDKWGLADTCKVIIDVIDENDNPPTIQLMSFSNTIAENSPVGTTVAVINVEDADSGQNGVVQCKINTDIPFKIESSISDYYALITDEILDRENTAEYNITILVSDQGSPALHSNKTLTVKISDVNDNAPVFDSDQYRTFITENNSPGVAVLTVQARDADWGPNARLSYFLEDSDVMGNPVSSLMSINSDSGVIHAVRSFDYEQMKSFLFNVTARDGGSPPLSSEVMVTVTVQDQNDNAPQVLYPVQTGGSLVAEIVPRSADVGYLVTKVVAVDVDSGQNAWLSYKLQRATDRALFEVGAQNGEIRTVRQVTDKDAVKQKLTVVVEDNGQPSRSAVVNINVAVADSFPEVVSEFSDFTQSREYNDNLTFYLVLALAAVSFLFITTVVVIISVKIYRWRQSRIFYQSNLPVIPYYPPGYADTGVTGTLPHMYNYDVCMTTNSRKSDCKYSTLGGQSVLVVDQSFSETLQRAMKEKEFLENAESPEELKWQAVFFFLCVYGMDVVFGQARYSIPEEMPEGSFVGNIAKDLGIEISRLVSGKARVVTKGGRQYVELSRDKGALVVKERIDREELCKQTTPCSFSFDLIIENPIQLHRITVEVQDINDNEPTFPKADVSLELSENRVSGARFPLDSAVDLDVGINGIQSYSLSPTDNFKLEINTQPDGSKHVEMVLQRELDREELDELQLVLIASDGGSPRKSGTVRIHVTVLDVNDNAPVCNQAVYKIDVKENSPVGSILATVSADDPDQGIYGQISYSIAQASKEARALFDINSETGEIKTLNKMDYEIKETYTLNVKAMDKGSLSDTCKVIIDVIDENDNPPTIQLMSFSNTIAENSAVGTTVAVINVEDADSGQNGVVQCKINTDIPFKIESSISDYYALITDEILDRENTAEYNITILVSDQGSPALHSNKTLTVKISDVNDNAPVFDSDQYRTFITENNSPGVAVLTVKARDADWGPNARLSYFLEDSDVMGSPVSSLMSINSDSGVIHAVRSFDYEQMKSFSFNVTARDGGSPPLSSEVMVTVTVQDQNDNAPQVLYPVQTGGSLVAEIVPRSADVGYLVTKVVAVDVDSGQNAWLSYKLQRATDRALFEVGPQNGEIRTVRQVTDKDAVKQKLTVVVEDNGQPSRSAVVNINVAVADSFPEVVSEFSDFTQSREYNDNLTFYLVLALAAVSFLFITTVVVIISVKIYRWRQSRIFYQSNLPVIPYYPPGYADTGVTGTLPHMYNYDVCMTTNSRKSDCKYSTLGGQSVLVVDQSFSETLQRAMKEKEFLENAESPEEFRSGLRDWPALKWQTAFFCLCVYGMDIVFGQARYSIPEEMPEGSFVGNIAKDLGIEISRLVSGKARVVTKGGRQYVELSRDKGALVVKERIDREELCKQTTPCSFSFDLIIENPIQLHRITVEVQDINDNAPKFPKSTVNMDISESTTSGTRFPLDGAVDLDVGINGVHTYSLNPTDNFKLEINNQPDSEQYIEMVLQHELDREDRDELKLVLTAYDGGSPKKSSTVQIHIKVLDANDNTPVCKQSVYKAEVRENSPVGTVLTTVSAADADEGINGQVSYSFAQASEKARNRFGINSETGAITTLDRLDYETQKSYQLHVKAMDNGGLADTCKVIIDVMDENDNPPTIQLMSFSNTIAESSPVGTTVAVINVEDADSGQNGVVQCKINTDIPFKIESSISDYYALITDEILDRENTAEYNITILVSDQGSPALHSNKTLTVKISDVNDNAPVFDSDQYRAFITENNSPGVAVLTVKARDADWGPNARLSYFVEDSDVMGNPVSSLMSINSDSGVIHAVRSFDYEQMKSFSFNVTARDGGSPPLSSEVMVTVTVQDQNDNAPQVLYPVQTGGSLVAEIVPCSADVGYLVTKVVAVDVDSGQNAWLSYKLQRATDRALFEVGPQNGEIRTVRQVTDKDAVKQKLIVVVEDNGQPSRSAVVNINVAVADSFPEVVSEFSDFTHSREYNDNLTFYLVLALAAVSFLFITTVVVIISVKIYRWRQSRIFYQSNLPVIPYYPPGYADTGVTGTLPHMYNYDVCMTTNSRKSDCKYSTLGGQSVLVVDQSFSETLQRAMKEKEFLENAESPEEVGSAIVLYAL